MEWIHCNHCYLRLQSNTRFYVTSCGHLNCQRCADRMKENHKKCFVCNKTCDAVALSNDLKPDIQCFFRPPGETLDKIKQVINFQLNNSLNLLKYISGKYNNAKIEIQKSYKLINNLKKENQELKMMLKQKNTSTNCFMASTPMAAPQSPMNGSFMYELNASQTISGIGRGVTGLNLRSTSHLRGPPSDRGSVGSIRYKLMKPGTGSLSSRVLESPMKPSPVSRFPDGRYRLTGRPSNLNRQFP